MKGQKTYRTYIRRYSTVAIFKGMKTGLFVNIGQYPFSWIRIRIPDTDPDPGLPIQGGSIRSGSTSTPLVNILPRTFSICSPKQKEFSAGSGQGKGSIFIFLGFVCVC